MTNNAMSAVNSFSKFLSGFFLASYALGFLVWNYLLSHIGIVQNDFLKPRFVLSGFLPAIVVFAVFNYIYDKDFYNRRFFKTLSMLLLLILLFLYARFLFPRIPSWLGGGQPRFVSLIGSTEAVSELGKFGILRADGSEIQTQNLCLVFENNTDVVLLLNDRIIQYNKGRFYGFGSIPIKEIDERKKDCSELLVKMMKNLPQWEHTGWLLPFIR